MHARTHWQPGDESIVYGPMMTDRAEYFRVSLRIQSTAQITALLSKEARHSGRMGEPRGTLPRTLAPRPEAARSERHYWCANFDDGDDLDGRLRSIAAFLSNHETEIAAITTDGGEIDVYAFISPVQGFVIEPAVLMTLASLGVALAGTGSDRDT